MSTLASTHVKYRDLTKIGGEKGLTAVDMSTANHPIVPLQSLVVVGEKTAAHLEALRTRGIYLQEVKVPGRVEGILFVDNDGNALGYAQSTFRAFPGFLAELAEHAERLAGDQHPKAFGLLSNYC